MKKIKLKPRPKPTPGSTSGSMLVSAPSNYAPEKKRGNLPSTCTAVDRKVHVHAVKKILQDLDCSKHVEHVEALDKPFLILATIVMDQEGSKKVELYLDASK